jgi:hypothetical protein
MVEEYSKVTGDISLLYFDIGCILVDTSRVYGVEGSLFGVSLITNHR